MPFTDCRSKSLLHRGGAERVWAATGQRGKVPQPQVDWAAETKGGTRKKTGGAERSEGGAKAGEFRNIVLLLIYNEEHGSFVFFLSILLLPIKPQFTF